MSPIIDKIIPDYLINSTQLYVVGLDVNGQVNFIGKKFELEFPLFKKEFYIHNFSNFLDENEHGLFEFLLSDLLESPNKSKQVYLNLSNKKKVNWEFSILKSDEGDIMGILGIGHEVAVETIVKSEIEEHEKALELSGEANNKSQPRTSTSSNKRRRSIEIASSDSSDEELSRRRRKVPRKAQRVIDDESSDELDGHGNLQGTVVCVVRSSH